MLTKLLFRAGLAEENELEIAQRHFDVIQERARIQRGDLIVPRYSLLPYAGELEADVLILGGTLINTTRQHHYVADIGNWYPDFEDLTPRTWMQVSDVPQDAEGSFVLKGLTNSRKQNWRTHMFAPTRADVSRVFNRLLDDPLISGQGIVARQFEKFRGTGEGINGLPITSEWRHFVLDDFILGSGFYWSEHFDELQADGDACELLEDGAKAHNFVRDIVIPRLRSLAPKSPRFIVVDMGIREDGTPRVVELNDGCMSGTSCIDLEALYHNLKLCLEKEG